MAVNINVPSQVKTYANLAAFPATGALKTIYIAEDTNKTYRWTGSVYTEISASAAMTWGAIGGTLSNQTDLQSALNAKQDNLGFTPVPTTRTLTINGTTQDLSADRTFTISTGITIGTTAITSGTVGRVLFQGTGNVVQQSSSLAYDDTLKTFTLIGPISSVIQHTALTNYNGLGGLQLNVADGTERGFFKLNPTSGEVRIGANGSGYFPTFYAQGVEAMRIFASTRNVGIGTTTDAGFKLDVNGTARVSGLVTATLSNYNSTHSGNTTRGFYIVNSADSVVRAGIEYDGTNAFVQLAGRFNNGAAFLRQDGGNGNISFLRNAVEYFRVFGATGNIALQNGGTFTDAGFRLDVNGTARVQGQLSLGVTGTAGRVNLARSSNGTMIGAIYTSGNDLVIENGSQAMIFNTIGAERMRFAATTANLLIGTTTDVPSALVTISSTTQGFLPPRMTTTQKNAIATPAAGLVVYDTTLNKLCVYTTAWETVTSL